MMRLCTAIFAFLLAFPSLLLAELPGLPQPTFVIPAPPTIAAKSFILIDPLSQFVIAEQNANERVEPASLTKMMTVYVVDQALKSGKLKLTDNVRISETAWRATGTRMFVEVNTEVPVQDLIHGVIIQSGNDASIALAEHIAGSEAAFAELMNFYAKHMGLNNTHFENATGLPAPNHYTTAKDMAVLAQHLIQDFPNTYKVYSQKEFVYKNIKQENRNGLLWANNLVDGIKTGFTDNAGYCLAASGKKDQMRLIAVVMGTDSDKARTNETNKLLTHGFQFYESQKLYPGLTALEKARVWGGNTKTVEVGLKDDLYATIGQGQSQQLKTVLHLNPTIKAPFTKGTAIGTVTVQFNDKPLSERPLIALADVEQGGIFSRFYDYIALSVHSLLNKAKSS